MHVIIVTNLISYLFSHAKSEIPVGFWRLFSVQALMMSLFIYLSIMLIGFSVWVLFCVFRQCNGILFTELYVF